MIIRYNSFLLFLVLIFISPIQIIGQSISQQYSPFTQIKGIEKKRLLKSEGTENTDIQILSIDSTIVNHIMKKQSLILEVPINDTIVKIQLNENNIISPSYGKAISGIKSITNFQPGQYFKGNVVGSKTGFTAISFHENLVFGIIYYEGKVYDIYSTKEDPRFCLLYEEKFNPDESDFSCNTVFDEGKNLSSITNYTPRLKSSTPITIDLYLECDHHMYEDFVTEANTEAWALGLMNVVFTIYDNNFTSFDLNIIDCHVWVTEDTYPESSSEEALDAFRCQNPTYPGRLAHLLSTATTGLGGKATLPDIGACPFNQPSHGFSNIGTTYDSNITNWSPSVYVIAHELGHQLGSPHTHACIWGGTQIDDCGNIYLTTNLIDDDNDTIVDELDEANPCYDPLNPKLPASGSSGTIMSYCHEEPSVPMSHEFHPDVQTHIDDFVVNCLDINYVTQPGISFIYNNIPYYNCQGFQCESSFGNVAVYSTLRTDLVWKYLGNIANQSTAYNPPIILQDGTGDYNSRFLEFDTSDPLVSESYNVVNNKLSIPEGGHIFEVENCTGATTYFGILLGNSANGCGLASGCTQVALPFKDDEPSQFLLKSNSNIISNIQHSIQNCSSQFYDVNISFDDQVPSTYHFEILYSDGSTGQLNNILANGIYTQNTIQNISSNIDMVVNIIDENVTTCQENEITINAQSCSPPPSSITHSCSISPGTANPNQIVEASGNIVYDTGESLVNGAITITVAGSTYNTSTDNNGNYSLYFSAPSSTSTVNVHVTDGVLTNNCSNNLVVQNPNPTGPAYQLVDHKIGHGIDANFQIINENYYWESVDQELFSWVELINVTSGLTLKWNFIRPDGILYYSDEHSVPNQNGGDYYAWMPIYINNSQALLYPGKWAVEVYGKLPGGNYSKLLSDRFFLSYELKRYTMCGNTYNDSNGAPQPTDEKNTFYTDEDNVIHWVQFYNVTEFVDMRYQLIQPNGNVYVTIQNPNVPHPNSSGYNWWDYYNTYVSAGIVGTPMANKTGNWKIKVSGKIVGGSWVDLYSDNFELIESPNVNPIASVAVNYTEPNENQNVIITYTATDNTLLNKVDKHYRIDNGVWQKISVNNLNTNSWTGNENLGQFTVGTKIDFYTTAIDNSGNVQSSNISNVYIRDNDMFPPNISNLTVVESGGNSNGIIDDTEIFELCADIIDDTGISTVEFYVDGVSVSLNSNYCGTFGPLNTGSHTFTVNATDSDNSPMTATNSTIFYIYDSCPYNLLVNNVLNTLSQSENSITTSGNVHIDINQNITYRSNAINLKPGFHAKQGAVHVSKVDPCSN